MLSFTIHVNNYVNQKRNDHIHSLQAYLSISIIKINNIMEYTIVSIYKRKTKAEQRVYYTITEPNIK